MDPEVFPGEGLSDTPVLLATDGTPHSGTIGRYVYGYYYFPYVGTNQYDVVVTPQTGDMRVHIRTSDSTNFATYMLDVDWLYPSESYPDSSIVGTGYAEAYIQVEVYGYQNTVFDITVTESTP